MKKQGVLVGLIMLGVILCMALSATAQQFTEIGASLNLPTTIGGAWGDYDKDGYPDLYIGGIWQVHPPMLLHNNGNGTFSNVTAAMGLPTTYKEDWGCAWGDYDNDGDLDLVVSGGNHPIYLYRNDGSVFTEVGVAAGFIWQPVARGVTWFDYDRDNWLDLYICYENSDWSRLYRNNHNGTFTEVTNASGMNLAPAALGSQGAAADYNNDGWIDLLVGRIRNLAGTGMPPRLYINHHDGTFTDQFLAACGSDVNDVKGVAWGDYDNDGDLDFYLSAGHTRPAWLYQNNGNGTFTNVYDACGMAGIERTAMGAAWADYDNDGLLDLSVANDVLSPFLWHNEGNGTFTDRAATEGMNVERHSRGNAWGDYDRDGKIDLFMASEDNFSCLYHNIGTTGNYLRVSALTDRDGDATDGTTSDDRDALGARVEVNLDNDAQFPIGRTIARVIDGGSSYMSQNEPIAQFGLGMASVVAVRAVFPDGAIVVQSNVSANQEIVLRDFAQTFGSVSGVVTNPAGLPVAGVTVSCGPISAITGADGTFLIPELCAGLTYAFTASSPTSQPTTVRDVAVTTGQTTIANFTVQLKPGDIAGTIRNSATSDPIAGATVSCAGQTRQTGADGTYRFSNLAAGGGYTVSASAQGYVTKEVTGVTVQPTQTTTVDISLDVVPGTISGKLYDEKNQKPLGGAHIELDWYWSTVTAPDGTYSFDGVPIGTDHTVSVYLPGYTGAWIYPIEVKTGMITVLNIPQVSLTIPKGK
jgi:hypothetical protein